MNKSIRLRKLYVKACFFSREEGEYPLYKCELQQRGAAVGASCLSGQFQGGKSKLVDNWTQLDGAETL